MDTSTEKSAIIQHAESYDRGIQGCCGSLRDGMLKLWETGKPPEQASERKWCLSWDQTLWAKERET